MSGESKLEGSPSKLGRYVSGDEGTGRYVSGDGESKFEGDSAKFWSDLRVRRLEKELEVSLSELLSDEYESPCRPGHLPDKVEHSPDNSQSSQYKEDGTD